MKTERLEQLQRDRAAKRPVALATNLNSGDSELLYPAEGIGTPALLDHATRALREDKGRTIDTPNGKIFLNPFNPPLRLFIVGAVHIAQPLCRMAALAGFDVTVIDPRTSFATEERFPGIDLDTAWPDEALTALGLDPRSAVVTLTHDPKLDDPALDAALRSECFYIGALGSKKTQAARVERLTAAGFDAQTIGRIHGPVGLDIGGRSPAEIAVSILAEIIAVLRT